MGLLDLFKKKSQMEQAETPVETAETEEFEIYSGMRVEVTTLDGDLLFTAKLMGLHGNTAELYQYSEAEISQETEPLHVKIRGYHDHDRKAVHMEATISPKPKHIWQVEDLAIAKVGNDRAFFRLNTNIDATATTFQGIGIGEKPCKLLNISVGGACIGSEHQYQEGDKFLLKVKLLEDREVSAMFCQVIRIIEKEDAKFEYGCRFLELNEADEAKITQNIFAVQRKKRGIS